jgi:hypothetical protein
MTVLFPPGRVAASVDAQDHPRARVREQVAANGT